MNHVNIGTLGSREVRDLGHSWWLPCIPCPELGKGVPRIPQGRLRILPDVPRFGIGARQPPLAVEPEKFGLPRTSDHGETAC